MAWNVLQSVGNTSGSANPAATFTSNLTAGSKLIAWVICGASGATISAVSDGAGHNFTSLISSSNGGAGWAMYVMDTPAVLAGTKPTITATCSDAPAGDSMVLAEVAGLAPGTTAAAILDSTAGQANATPSSSFTPTFGSYTSSTPGEFLIAAYADGGDSGSTASPQGSPWTALTGNQNGNSASNTLIVYKNSTGAAESASWGQTTCSSSDAWATILVAFRLSSSGIAVPQQSRARRRTRAYGRKYARQQPWAVPQAQVYPVYAGAASATVTVQNSTSPGDVIVCAMSTGANVTAMADSQGNTYLIDSPDTSNENAVFYAAYNGSSGTPTKALTAGVDTLTLTGGNGSGGIVAAGVRGAAPYAADAAPAFTRTTSTTSPSFASVTPSNAGDIVLGILLGGTALAVSSWGSPLSTAWGFDGNSAGAWIGSGLPGSTASYAPSATLAATANVDAWTLALLPFGASPSGTAVALADTAAAEDTDSLAFQAAAAVPLADVAGAAETIGSITAAIPLAEVAGAAESLTVTATVPLSEVAGAAEAIVPAAAVPLAEVAAGVESLAAAAAVPVADVAGAVDSETAGIAITYGDVAAGTDAITWTGIVTYGDVAGAADALSVQASVPLADVAAGTDAVTETAAVPLADVAGADESAGVSAAVPVADPGAAADSISPAASVPLPDTAGAAESVIAGSPTTEPDVAGAAESAAVSAAVPAADVAGAADSLAVAAAASLADVAAGTEQMASGEPAAEPDTAAAADSLTAAVTTAAAEVAAGADALAVQASVALPDVAAARDAETPAAASVPLGDTAGAAEAAVVQAASSAADAAGSAEALQVQKPYTGPSATWEARSAPPRWHARPSGPRWAACPVPSRWQLQPALSRWSLHPAQSRWRILMSPFEPISALSPEDINVNWTSDLDGTVVDPTTAGPGGTALAVMYALPASSGNPAEPAQPTTWYTAQWLAGGTGKGFIAQCPAGPGTSGPALTSGMKYDVWSQVLNAGSESPVKFAGTQAVY